MFVGVCIWLQVYVLLHHFPGKWCDTAQALTFHCDRFVLPSQALSKGSYSFKYLPSHLLAHTSFRCKRMHKIERPFKIAAGWIPHCNILQPCHMHDPIHVLREYLHNGTVVMGDVDTGEGAVGVHCLLQLVPGPAVVCAAQFLHIYRFHLACPPTDAGAPPPPSPSPSPSPFPASCPCLAGVFWHHIFGPSPAFCAASCQYLQESFLSFTLPD